MTPENLKELLLECLNSGMKPNKELLDALNAYSGDDEVLLGAKAFLIDHNQNFETLQSSVNNIAPIEPQARPRLRLGLVAAAVLMIAALSLLFICSKSTNKTVVIEEGLPVFMGDSPSSFNAFMNDYRLGNYDEAIEKGKQQLHTNPSDTLYFYLGCCYNYTQHYPQALECFSHIRHPAQKNLAIHYQTAFALVNAGQKEKAIPLLMDILRRPDSAYKTETRTLFNNLK